MADRWFTGRVLRWYRDHGRKDLPWQRDSTPYAVWISEIMLQQTRVETVIPYFERFMQRFPSVAALAAADLDQVLHQWSGLGYYARARNLHHTARILVDEYGEEFPDDLEGLSNLPGIGRSTAGAILSLAMGRRATILDGNVKRVLARFHAVDGWPGHASVQKELWQLAEQHTPTKEVSRYNQAMMDLGATLCTRTLPSCGSCPVAARCQALATGRTGELPAPKPKRALPVREVQLLVIRNAAGEVLLERRPPSGIWGGLWSFPEVAGRIVPSLPPSLGVAESLIACGARRTPFRHTFTHFHLDITPVHLELAETGVDVAEAGRWCWYDPGEPVELGLAAPVARVLRDLEGAE